MSNMRAVRKQLVPDLVEEHYVRYLHNGFRSYWGFTGNPLRIVLRRKAG